MSKKVLSGPTSSCPVPNQRPLARASRQSRLSTNYKGDNEMIPSSVHRSPSIYLTSEENPGKLQLGDRLMKTVRPGIASNGVPFL